MTTDLATQRAQFAAEFEQIEDTISHACAELAKLLNSYRLQVGTMADAQAHALAGIRGLRKAAEQIDPTARPVTNTRPQAWTGTLADQLASHRASVAQTLALVQHMPGVDSRRVAALAEMTADRLHAAEQIARAHQPSKARQ